MMGGLGRESLERVRVRVRDRVRVIVRVWVRVITNVSRRYDD